MYNPKSPNLLFNLPPATQLRTQKNTKSLSGQNKVGELDEEPSLKKFPIAKLNLDKISHKISNEKSTTKAETSLESLFEDIIAYFNIRETKGREFSFSSEKYEHTHILSNYEQAVNFLKAKEDERRVLMSEQEKVKGKLEKCKKKVCEELVVKEELSERVEQIKEDIGRQEVLISRMMYKGMTEAGFQTEDLEYEENSFLAEMNSFGQTPEDSINSESCRHLCGNTYKVHSSIKLYIDKLQGKISDLSKKKKLLYNENKALLARLSL